MMTKAKNLTKLKKAKTDGRYCEDCDELIPDGRIKAVPDCVLCVPCLEIKGDVFKYRAPKGIESISDICRSKEEFEALKKQLEQATTSRGRFSGNGE